MSSSHSNAGEVLQISAAFPRLPYSLRDRKRAIAIEWSLIVISSCLIPVVLFYALWFGTDIKHGTIFAIITPILGVQSFFTYGKRLYALLKKDSALRPVGSKRSSLDFFHICYTFGFVILTAELVGGTIPEEPWIRLLSMPVPSLLFIVGGLFLISWLMCIFHARTPFRVSTVPAGAYTRPAVYALVEDIVAVDGHGGQEWRIALNVRYEASPVFRQMMDRLNLFWGIGAVGIATVLTILIFMLPETVGFGLGWGIPFIWAGIWTLLTFRYVHYRLAEEKATQLGGPSPTVFLLEFSMLTSCDLVYRTSWVLKADPP